MQFLSKEQISSIDELLEMDISDYISTINELNVSNVKVIEDMLKIGQAQLADDLAGVIEHYYKNLAMSRDEYDHIIKMILSFGGVAKNMEIRIKIAQKRFQDLTPECFRKPN